MKAYGRVEVNPLILIIGADGDGRSDTQWRGGRQVGLGLLMKVMKKIMIMINNSNDNGDDDNTIIIINFIV